MSAAAEKTDLWEHIHDMHRWKKLPGGCKPTWSLAKLRKWHANEHHRFSPNHHHGPNPGPDQRPPGWRTGKDVVMVRGTS